MLLSFKLEGILYRLASSMVLWHRKWRKLSPRSHLRLIIKYKSVIFQEKKWQDFLSNLIFTKLCGGLPSGWHSYKFPVDVSYLWSQPEEMPQCRMQAGSLHLNKSAQPILFMTHIYLTMYHTKFSLVNLKLCSSKLGLYLLNFFEYSTRKTALRQSG